jgi:hypothetical protein
MPQARHIPPGYTVIRPNRDRAICKLTKAAVALILVISVALMLIVTIGGWSELEGLKPVTFAWCIVYLIIAVYVMRWSRGLLPIAAGLAILLGVVALIAGAGLSGTTWFDRSHAGYAPAQSLFGGTGLSSNTLGVVTLLIVPVQVALVIVAMRGFAQGWNVELELPIEEAERRRRGTAGPPPAGPQPPEPATA